MAILTKAIVMAQTPQKIVIVDDDEFLLKLISYTFEANGYDIQTFSTGKECLDYLSDLANLQNTKLIILDRLLGDMDGLDILRILSKQYPKQMPLVLILSALSAETDVLQGLDLGAVDYLAKPFSPDILLDQVRNLLNNYQRHE